jgi:hypothetical protein
VRLAGVVIVSSGKLGRFGKLRSPANLLNFIPHLRTMHKVEKMRAALSVMVQTSVKARSRKCAKSEKFCPPLRADFD